MADQLVKPWRVAAPRVAEIARRPARAISVNLLLVLVALYLALTQNLPFWHLVVSSLPGPLSGGELRLLAHLFVALVGLLVLAMLPLSAPRTVKPALIAVLLIAAVCSHFMQAYGTIIDSAMIANLFQTDAREASELIGWRLLLHVAGFGIAPALVIARLRLDRAPLAREALRRGALLLVVLLVLVADALAGYKPITLWSRAHREFRLYLNPSYPIYSFVRYFDLQVESPIGRVEPIGEDAVRVPAASGKPRVMLLLVGETARAANFQLLGYPRATNPELAARGDVAVFSRTESCGTATAISVPCMFSRLGRSDFSRARARGQENLLDVLHRTGVNVLWRDNNSDCKGVCARVPSEDLRHADDPAACSGDGCYDEVLLRGLDEQIARADGDRLIVLHLLGSHGPSYYRRYPPAFRHFTPDCAQDDVQRCSQQEIVNAYDNSLIYTDHVIAQAIALLQRHQDQVEPTLIYLSDHGESLGENGIYLHGLPYALAPEEQKHVPFLAWAPEADSRCLRLRRDLPYSQDNLFDTVLGAFGVRSTVYRFNDDVLRGCNASARATP